MKTFKDVLLNIYPTLQYGKEENKQRLFNQLRDFYYACTNSEEGVEPKTDEELLKIFEND